MDDAGTKLDGNAAAGLLGEIFAFDVTTADTACAACGRRNEIGALAAYMDAPGAVLRCPSCSGVMLRMVHGGGRYWLELTGMLFLQIWESEG
jgi:hypothetical protein